MYIKSKDKSGEHGYYVHAYDTALVCAGSTEKHRINDNYLRVIILCTRKEDIVTRLAITLCHCDLIFRLAQHELHNV